MDNQDDKKKYEKSYDDYFRDNDKREDDSAASESASILNKGEQEVPQAAQSSSEQTTYYSYGPYKSDQSLEEPVVSQPASTEASLNTGQQSQQSFDGSNGVQAPRPIQQQQQFYYPGQGGYVQGGGQGGIAPQAYNAAQQSYHYQPQQPPQQQSQLRQFTTSGNAERGGWQKTKKEPRKTSFKAVFASFMVGVLTVGGLMFAADTQNWFTKDQPVVSQQSAAGSSSTGSANAGNSGSSSSNAVVANRPDNIAQLFESASPAVVKIETYQKVGSRGSSIFDDPFFRQFFGDGGRSGQSQQQDGDDSDANMQQSGIGTGFFFEESGYILTNQHVVGGSDLINVIVQGYEEPFKAELLGNSFDLDLAVLKITGEQPFPTLPLGSSDDINIGDWVIAIGNPYGFDHTVTVGVISAKERPIEIQDADGTRNYEHLLQTDASINPGNSGGPLLNVNGEVVGINTAVSSQAQGIGFAIPTSTIESVIENLVANVEIPKEPIPFIGATLQNVTEAYAERLGLDKVEGSIVTDIYYNSPAYLGDLKQFDVITGIEGTAYPTMEALIAEIQSRKVGDKITMNIIRRGEKLDLIVELGDRNEFITE